MTEEIDEISVDEFMELPEASGRTTKVDYNTVINTILGKPILLTDVRNLMLANSSDKATVYSSEVTRFLNTLPKKGYKVVFRVKGGKRMVLVQKKGSA
jgi:hypothetical protein